MSQSYSSHLALSSGQSEDAEWPQLGRYRVEGVIGQGAMAEVYRAHDPEIGRTVAVKVLKTEYMRDPQLGARFLREARAAGALSHPNIATIYDAGEVDGKAFIAMELIAGEPLETLLQKHGRIAHERVLRLARQLADALAYAHRSGIVHRDVKPSNIMISADGQTAKLLDFGVARIDEGDSGHLGRTQAGQLLGTPRYMSPEQALGLPVDHRSDLFSLGVVMYEMITGTVAFPGASLATLAIQIAQEKVAPIGDATTNCPTGVRAIIDRLLAKKPEQRFADGAALVEAIDRQLDELREVALPRRGLSMRTKLPLALASVTAIALAGSVYFISEREAQLLEGMATASGNSIAAFVTSNAALTVVDNAGLPPREQNWTGLQAFVVSASHNVDVRQIIISDSAGTIRAASDPKLVGTRFAAPENAAALPGTLRFERPIDYAGARFGTVELALDRSSLDEAIATSRMLLIALCVLIMAVVVVAGYASGAIAARPLRRLRSALDIAARGDFSVRLSQGRSDEFGSVFEAFNNVMAEAETRAKVAPDQTPLAATRIDR